MMASTGAPFSKPRRYSTRVAGERRPAATAGQGLTSPRSTAGRAEANTSRRIASSSRAGNSRMVVSGSDTAGSARGGGGGGGPPKKNRNPRPGARRREAPRRARGTGQFGGAGLGGGVESAL